MNWRNPTQQDRSTFISRSILIGCEHGCVCVFSNLCQAQLGNARMIGSGESITASVSMDTRMAQINLRESTFGFGQRFGLG